MTDPIPSLAARFKPVLDAAPDAMVIADRLGRMVVVNAEAEKLFGYSSEELLGSTVEMLIPERFRRAHPRHRNHYFTDPRTRPMGALGGLELFGLRKDGSEFPSEISLSPLETEDGMFAITAIRDVTARKKVEQERARLHRQLEAALAELGTAYDKTKEAERLKTQFFANVSHELRTPLALILGPAEKLLTSSLAVGPRRDVEVIARNARTLAKHVSDLLDVTKLEAGKMRLEPTEVDVAQLVRVVASHFDALAAEREVSYAVEAPPAMAASLDVEKLQRVLFNLLSNAFKFAPVHGSVRCTLRPGSADGAPLDRGFRIEVADSGPGVPSAQRLAVFARFARGDDETTRRVGGTGLGLAIAKEFAELHGGRVDLGDAPEGGALFTIHLPPRAPAGTSAAPPALEDLEYGLGVLEELRSPAVPVFARGGSDRPRVLVVEDNPDMSRFVGEVLSAEFEVVTAPDGEAGLASALAGPPDAIVTDLMMPRMTGDQLVRALREHRELDAVPVLVITARSDEALRVQLLQEGAQDYLMKPFVVGEVLARVGNLVEMKRAREVLQREVALQSRDVAALAAEVAARKRELEAALAVAELARDEAQRASGVKTQFLRLVSHELRTPLTQLHLQLQRLARDQQHPLEGHQRDVLRQGNLAATRLTGIIEALLHEALIASGRLAVAVEDVDLAALARKVIEEARPQAEEKSLALRLRAPEHVPWVETEPRFLQLILSNLVGNAIKFTAAGAVEIRIASLGDELRVSVSDSGPGISAEDRARVFEPFERGAAAVQTFVPGLGLGLAVVRDLAAAIGARVDLDSAPGAGTTFTIVLPRRQPASARSVTSSWRGASS
jgi:PAS domain S-box-containing protein